MTRTCVAFDLDAHAARHSGNIPRTRRGRQAGIADCNRASRPVTLFADGHAAPLPGVAHHPPGEPGDFIILKVYNNPVSPWQARHDVDCGCARTWP